MTLQITIRNSIIIIDVSCITLCDGYQNMFRRISCYYNKYIVNLQPWTQKIHYQNYQIDCNSLLRYDVILIVLYYLQEACISWYFFMQSNYR